MKIVDFGQCQRRLTFIKIYSVRPELRAGTHETHFCSNLFCRLNGRRSLSTDNRSRAINSPVPSFLRLIISQRAPSVQYVRRVELYSSESSEIQADICPQNVQLKSNRVHRLRESNGRTSLNVLCLPSLPLLLLTSFIELTRTVIGIT